MTPPQMPEEKQAERSHTPPAEGSETTATNATIRESAGEAGQIESSAPDASESGEEGATYSLSANDNITRGERSGRGTISSSAAITSSRGTVQRPPHVALSLSRVRGAARIGPAGSKVTRREVISSLPRSLRSGGNPAWNAMLESLYSGQTSGATTLSLQRPGQGAETAESVENGGHRTAGQGADEREDGMETDTDMPDANTDREFEGE